MDRESYNVEMYIVSDSAIGYYIILCRPLFQKSAELRVSPQSVTIIHVNIARQLMNINTNNNELDVGVRAYSTAVRELVNSHCPVKHITTPMKTVIILNDEVPVYQRQGDWHHGR